MACVAIPGKRWSTAMRRAPAAASSALDGTHLVFTHVPPVVPRSIITTDAPASRTVIAPSRIAHAISAEVLAPSADRVNLNLLSFR